MVNKYRVKKSNDVTLFEDKIYVYSAITDMYHCGQIAVTEQFIKNMNSHSDCFEPVPETYVDVDFHGSGRYTVTVVMPENEALGISHLKEIIYNALNSQK